MMFVFLFSHVGLGNKSTLVKVRKRLLTFSISNPQRDLSLTFSKYCESLNMTLRNVNHDNIFLLELIL